MLWLTLKNKEKKMKTPKSTTVKWHLLVMFIEHECLCLDLAKSYNLSFLSFQFYSCYLLKIYEKPYISKCCICCPSDLQCTENSISKSWLKVCKKKRTLNHSFPEWSRFYELCYIPLFPSPVALKSFFNLSSTKRFSSYMYK